MNGKTKMALGMALAFLTLLLTPNYIAGQQFNEQKRIPGMPDNALQFNRTDITPVRHVERITAREMHVFAYRNVTLMLNCTRNMELNITIDPQVTPQYFWLVVEPNHAMNMNMNLSVSPPQGVMTMERSLNFYSTMEPNATIQLRAQLRFYINETALNAELNREINRSRLMWHYWNRTGFGWVPVESYIDEDGYLTCNTTHFSTWTVVEMMPLQVTGSLSKTEATIGEAVTVSAMVKDEAGSSITGATVKATVESTVLDLSDQGNGNYEGTVDTSKLSEGTFNVVVTAQKEGYYSNQDTVTLNVQPQPTDWTTYILIGVVLAAVVAAVLIYMRRT